MKGSYVINIGKLLLQFISKENAGQLTLNSLEVGKVVSGRHSLPFFITWPPDKKSPMSSTRDHVYVVSLHSGRTAAERGAYSTSESKVLTVIRQKSRVEDEGGGRLNSRLRNQSTVCS